MGEAAVKMNRIMGGKFLSKRLYYAPPGTDQIDEIRKYYGDVYPTVPGKADRKTAAAKPLRKTVKKVLKKSVGKTVKKSAGKPSR
jgi:hypothetical protein